MGRQPCCDKVGLKRGPWTIEEDNKLIDFMLNNGIQCWRLVPKLAGLMRCGKSCRLRWINYLRPDLKRGAWTEAEEDMLFQLHSRLGNRWSKIAAHFPGRTDNEIKNHWNTKIKKKLKHLGLDPVTHMPNVLKDQGIKDMQKPTCLSDDYTKPEGDNTLNTSDYYEVKSGGIISKCSSSDEGNSSHVLNNNMEECPKIGFDQVPNTEWEWDSHSLMGMNQFQSQTYDPFQSWIYSPLPWGAFNNFQDDFI